MLRELANPLVQDRSQNKFSNLFSTEMIMKKFRDLISLRFSLKWSLVLIALVAVAMAVVAEARLQRQREVAFLTRLEKELTHRLVIQTGNATPKNWFRSYTL